MTSDADLELFVGNDMLLTLNGVKDKANNDAFINSATVEVTLTDVTGAEVSGETWPLAVPYVSGSNGNYEVVLADTLAATPKRMYDALITVDAGAGKRGSWTKRVRAKTRRF